MYLGSGWAPFKGFAFGANASYLWGSLSRNVINTYSDTYVNTLSKEYASQVKSYKIDFGVQYSHKFDKKNELTLGLTYSLGHKLNSDSKCSMVSKNSQTGVSDTTSYVLADAFELPNTFGIGFMWNHDNRLKIGVDYQLQKWAKIKYPQLDINGSTTNYSLVGGQFNDLHKITLGGDYCKGERYRGFFDRMHYRAGISYASPYLKINGVDGPRELSASLGVGIPIVNAYNNRSILNISAEWVNRSATGFVKENMFRINVGLTFNERWFAKFKVE